MDVQEPIELLRDVEGHPRWISGAMVQIHLGRRASEAIGRDTSVGIDLHVTMGGTFEQLEEVLVTLGASAFRIDSP